MSSSGNFPDPGLEPVSLESPALASGLATTEPPGKTSDLPGSVNSLCPSNLERHEVPVLLYISRLIFRMSSALPCFPASYLVRGGLHVHFPGDDGTSYLLTPVLKQGHQLELRGKKTLCRGGRLQFEVSLKMLSVALYFIECYIR